MHGVGITHSHSSFSSLKYLQQQPPLPCHLPVKVLATVQLSERASKRASMYPEAFPKSLMHRGDVFENAYTMAKSPTGLPASVSISTSGRVPHSHSLSAFVSSKQVADEVCKNSKTGVPRKNKRGGRSA